MSSMSIRYSLSEGVSSFIRSQAEKKSERDKLMLYLFSCAAEFVNSPEFVKFQNSYSTSLLFKDLCIESCDLKDYESALKCQQLAKEHFVIAGNKNELYRKSENPADEAMCYLIKSRVADPTFLEESENLIQLSLALTNDNYKFGLQALLEISKKFNALKLTKKATEVMEELIIELFDRGSYGEAREVMCNYFSVFPIKEHKDSGFKEKLAERIRKTFIDNSDV